MPIVVESIYEDILRFLFLGGTIPSNLSLEVINRDMGLTFHCTLVVQRIVGQVE